MWRLQKRQTTIIIIAIIVLFIFLIGVRVNMHGDYSKLAAQIGNSLRTKQPNTASLEERRRTQKVQFKFNDNNIVQFNNERMQAANPPAVDDEYYLPQLPTRMHIPIILQEFQVFDIHTHIHIICSLQSEPNWVFTMEHTQSTCYSIGFSVESII
jgi:hypothetical protein